MTFEEFKEAVIKTAKDNGLTDYEIYYAESDGINVSIFKDEIKEYSVSNGLGVCFKCIIDGKSGNASTENFSMEDASSIVLRAIDNAKSIENDELTFIHKKGDTYATLPEVEGSVPSGKELSSKAFEIQKELYAADTRVVDGSESEAGHISVKYALVNSNGLDLKDEASFDYEYAYAIVEADGEKYDGYVVKSEKIDALDVKALANETAKKACATIGAKSLPTGKYKGILNNEVMYTFLSTYASVFFAEAAQKGLSLLKDKEGEMIAADFVTITDDPMEASACVKRTFDGEGVATYKKNIVEDGRLVTLLYNLKSANTAGVKSTGNGSKASYTAPVGTSPFSFFINAGTTSEEDLFKAVGDGVLVTDISGLHAGANPTSGDFSLLSEGFIIKDGKKDRPIKNFTISGNFFDLLKDVKVLGNDFKFSSSFGSSRFGAPSALFDEISIAGE